MSVSMHREHIDKTLVVGYGPKEDHAAGQLRDIDGATVQIGKPY